jgi:hypothetical protein
MGHWGDWQNEESSSILRLLRGRLQIDRTIKIGEFLTIVTILVSVATLWHTFSQDQQLRKRDQATRIRDAAAQTLAKLDRLQELSTWVFDAAEPIFIDVSEEFNRTHDAPATRDMLWKAINQTRIKTEEQFLDEKIETGYVNLLPFDASIRDKFMVVLRDRAKQEEEMFDLLLAKTQKDVLAFRSHTHDYTPALMGNALRATANEVRSSYQEEMNRSLKPIQDFLVGLMGKSDDQLLSASH